VRVTQLVDFVLLLLLPLVLQAGHDCCQPHSAPGHSLLSCACWQLHTTLLLPLVLQADHYCCQRHSAPGYLMHSRPSLEGARFCLQLGIKTKDHKTSLAHRAFAITTTALLQAGHYCC
jgi:hypothetical protein